MSHPRRLPLTALLATGLLGFTACADDAPGAKTEAAPAAEPAPAAPAEKAPDAPADTAAAKPAPKKPSPEEAARTAARREVDRLALEKLRLDTEMQIASLRERAARIPEEDERARIETEAALRAAKTALANAKEDIARADRDRAIAIAAAKAALARQKDAATAGELETAAKLAKQETDNEILKLSADAARNRRENEARRMIEKRVVAGENPVRDGTLYISDRRILINGLITDGTAAGVISKLNFFSLADPKAPVFLIMETVPGGNAMAAYQIMKAVESCPAPVHVVVKSQTGGAASAIVAAAPHSYTIPHARIVFQQPASPSRGATLGAQRDGLRVAESWYDRLHAAVAKKEGISPADFAAETYRHNSGGEWLEFGDKAVGRKWVDTLVDRIVEESVDSLPPAPPPGVPAPQPARGGLEQRMDASGRPYFALPPLPFGDLWMIHDPEHLYRSAN